MNEILLVSSDRGVGTPIADGLAEAGYEVMWCRGPQKPTFVCAAARGRRCPLTAAATVAVVDGWLESDENECGIPSWELAAYYHDLGIPVIALVGPNGFPSGGPEAGLLRLPRDTDADEIVTAVQMLTAYAAEGVIDLTSRSA